MFLVCNFFGGYSIKIILRDFCVHSLRTKSFYFIFSDVMEDNCWYFCEASSIQLTLSASPRFMQQKSYNYFWWFRDFEFTYYHLLFIMFFFLFPFITTTQHLLDSLCPFVNPIFFCFATYWCCHPFFTKLKPTFKSFNSG